MRNTWLARALVAAAALVVLVPNSPSGRVPSEDAGVFFYAARALLTGGTPYLDVWDHKPPAIYLIDAVGLGLAGAQGVWWLQVAALVAAALLTLRAFTRVLGRAAAVAGTLAWVFAAPRLFLTDGQQTSYVEFFVLPLQAAALAIVAAHPGLRLRRRDGLLLGALAGIALLLKPTLIGVWVALAIVLLWTRRREAISAIVAMALGGGAVLMLVAALFASRGALGEMLDQALRYNLAYASFAPFVERLGAIPEGLRLVSPSGLALVALLAAGYALVRRRALPPLVLIALVALPLELLLATSGRAYHYYFLPWLPVMGTLAAFAVSETLRALASRPALTGRRSLEGRRALAVIGIAVIAMAIQPARLVGRLATESDDGISRAAAEYVASHTAPADPVLIWGARSEVLFLADRRSPTRFIFQYAPVATRNYATTAAIDALLADLAAHPPALIVDASAGSFVTPPLDRAGFRGWVSPEPQYAWPPETEQVIAFVEARYVRAGEIDGSGWPIWRRR